MDYFIDLIVTTDGKVFGERMKCTFHQDGIESNDPDNRDFLIATSNQSIIVANKVPRS